MVELREERNWVPLVVATLLVGGVIGASFLVHGHSQAAATSTSTSTPSDPYSLNLPLTNLTMSESSNLAGGKVTYLDGHIANRGMETVTGITVQVLFRNSAHEIVQNATVPLTLVRMREPYVDIESVAAEPLKPGAERDYRLIFDGVSPDWSQETPEIRILTVQLK